MLRSATVVVVAFGQNIQSLVDFFGVGLLFVFALVLRGSHVMWQIGSSKLLFMSRTFFHMK